MRARNNNDTAVYEDPAPVLPHSMAELKNSKFCEFLTEQRARLLTTMTALQISEIELQHGDLVDLLTEDNLLAEELDALGGGDVSTVGFKEAWSTGSLSTRFPTLFAFAGGLASPFPVTATTESDFSIMRYERDSHRLSLENLALAGCMQCKQYVYLKAKHTTLFADQILRQVEDDEVVLIDGAHA